LTPACGHPCQSRCSLVYLRCWYSRHISCLVDTIVDSSCLFLRLSPDSWHSRKLNVAVLTACLLPHAWPFCSMLFGPRLSSGVSHSLVYFGLLLQCRLQLLVLLGIVDCNLFLRLSSGCSCVGCPLLGSAPTIICFSGCLPVFLLPISLLMSSLIPSPRTLVSHCCLVALLAISLTWLYSAGSASTTD
jgi:hypothetical protein